MQKQQMYVYPAIFNYAEDGISVSFPDLPGCLTCGSTEAEAQQMARDALNGYIECAIEHSVTLAKPTSLDRIALEENERVFPIET